MKGSAALFSTKKNSKNITARDDWETPADFFESFCDAYGRPDLDVCADAENSKCGYYYTEAMDGLSLSWNKHWWCNPPYSEIKLWVRKAASAYTTAPGTMLVPARTETDWWWSALSSNKLARIVFLKPRLSFELAPEKEKKVLRGINKKRREKGLKPIDKLPGSTFPSALLIFSHNDNCSPTEVSWWNWKEGRHI